MLAGRKGGGGGLRHYPGAMTPTNTGVSIQHSNHLGLLSRSAARCIFPAGSKQREYVLGEFAWTLISAPAKLPAYLAKTLESITEKRNGEREKTGRGGTLT